MRERDNECKNEREREREGTGQRTRKREIVRDLERTKLIFSLSLS